MLFNQTPSLANADSKNIKYTTVLEDLRADKEFDVLNYPIKNEDYSLQVVSIAESINKELFMYQPQYIITQNGINCHTVFYKIFYLNLPH